MEAAEPPKYIYEYQYFRGKTAPKNGYNWQPMGIQEGSRLPVWRKLISKKINPAYTKYYSNKMNELANIMSGLKIENNGKMEEESNGGARKTRRRQAKHKRKTRRHRK
jgi:hypothetical protein